MASIPGTVVAAKITTGDTVNTYAIGDCNEMQGTVHSVADATARDAITSDRRREGMLCYQIDNEKTYQLVGGTANTDWVEYSASPSGGGFSIYQVAVGPSETYTTVGAAVTAGYTRILLLGDTTETGDIALPDDFLIQGIGKESVNINMGTYQFTVSSTENFTFLDLKITYAYSSINTRLFTEAPNLNFVNVYFDNNSTADRTQAVYNTSYYDVYLRNVTMDCPDVRYGGLYNAGQTFLFDVYLNGGGSNCYDCFNLLGRFTGNNLIIDGTVKTTERTILFQYGAISNIYNFVESVLLKFTSSTVVNVVSKINSAMQIEAVGSKITNVDMRDSDSSMETSGNGENQWTGIFVNGDITVGADFDVFTNIICAGDLTVNGDNTTITSSRIGNKIGGGSETITISASADSTVVSNCMLDADLSDSGTNTIADYTIF